MRIFLALLSGLFLVLTMAEAKAWNAEGHQIVGARERPDDEPLN
jgi:hypothetical protein